MLLLYKMLSNPIKLLFVFSSERVYPNVADEYETFIYGTREKMVNALTYTCFINAGCSYCN